MEGINELRRRLAEENYIADEALTTTLWIALLTTALCLLLGFPIAFTLMAMGLSFGYLGMGERVFDLLVQRTYAVMANDVLISGYDILFFWDARMAMQGLHFMGDVPWKRLYLHGLVRAADGQALVLVQVLDVHARKTHELALEDVAHRDALTGQ